MIPTGQEINAKKLFDRAQELGVLDMVRFLWREGRQLYPDSRISAQGHGEFRFAETERSIYTTIFYLVPCVAGESCLEKRNYVSITLSPTNLSRLTHREERECMKFLQDLATGMDTRVILFKSGWYYLSIATLEKAEQFFGELQRFLDNL